MKLVITTALAAFAMAAATLPSYAGTHCYYMNGRTVCCTTIGNYTSCF